MWRPRYEGKRGPAITSQVMDAPEAGSTIGAMVNLSSSVRPSSRPPFGEALKGWRRMRGVSQLDLSLEAGTSSRHISFLETGRSNPSRRMVLRLMNALEVPLRDRNPLLVVAGFAPVYGESSLDGAELSQVRRCIRFLLDGYEPYPAYVLNRTWDIVEANSAYRSSLAALLPGVGERQNALDLLLDPLQLRPVVINWDEVSYAVLRRLRRQIQSPEPTADLVALWQRVNNYPGVQALLSRVDDSPPGDVVVPLEMRVGDTVQRWLTTIVTFGTPLDVTVQDTVIECFFPADEATEMAVRAAGP